MKKIAVFILFILAVLTGFSACGPAHFKYQKTFVGAFDTVTVITGYAKNKQEFENVATAIYSDFEEYSNLYDIYADYSGINNLKKVNENAGVQPVEVDERIINMLEFAISMSDLTNGNVNVAMGSVLSLWHDEREKGLDNPDNAKIPDLNELEKASEHTNINDIVIDKEKHTVFLKDEKMLLDVGAIAKGYAVEQICRKYDGEIIATVNVGGNVRTIGNKPDGKPWSVGIQDSDAGGKIDSVVKIEAGYSVVTSGNYQRYYIVDGKKYNHIIDPDTLFPQDKYKSVTVICADSGIADALSTALSIMTIDDGMALVDSMQDVEAYWITVDDAKYKSGGFLNE